MSITKNYLYNLLYQIVVLLVPLITIPYISRVLGSEGVGANAYTHSILQYFVLAGSIGISMYGNRTIAYIKNDIEKLNSTFWSIFYLKIITTSLAFGAFLIFLNYVNEFHFIFVIQSVYIIAAMFDITWLYIGLEDFKKTVIRNLIVKIISTIAIFIFVQNPEDLWKYVLLLVLSQLIGNLTLYMYLPKTVSFVRVSLKEIFSHLKPTLALFIPQVSIQIYLVLNKTMLGIFGNTHEVGIFDNSDRIVKILLALVTAMGIVMLPRVASTYASGDKGKVNGYLHSSFKFQSYLAIPLMFGLIAIVPNFTPWFFGPGFEDTVNVIMILSPIVLFIAWSNVFGTQYLLAIGKTKLFTLSVTVGAVVNLLLNFYFIPRYFSIGAAIGTLIAEFAVTLVQYIMVRKEIRLKVMFDGFGRFLLSGLVMYLVVWYIGNQINPSMFSTFIQIFVGMIVYIGLLVVFKSDINNKIIGFVLKKVLKK